MLTKIVDANNLHILLLLVTNVLQINNISQHPTLSAYINTNYPDFKTCHAMYQYYLLKYIIPICIFTATTTDGSCSYPHYHGYIANSIPIPVVLLRLLSPFPHEYRHHCPHYRSNYRGYHDITAVPYPTSLFSICLCTYTI